MTIEQKFWKHVKKTETCWLWIGATRKYPQGGCLTYGRMNDHGKQRKSHRISWEIHNGSIPEGLWVLHKCDVSLCVRPDHLYLGNHADNTRDMITRKRTARGSKHGFAKLKEEDIPRIRVMADSIPKAHIARLFKVAPKTIRNIIGRKTWNSF